MRNLVAFLALIAFMPSAHAAGTEVSNSGMYRVRSASVSNVGGMEGVGSQDIASTFKWGINFKANDKFGANLTLLHDAVWGEDAASDQHRQTASDQEDALRVIEAYGSWMASDELSFRFGRASFGIGDGRVMDSGATDNANAFEGVTGTYDAEVGRIMFFGLKGYDLTADNSQDPEVNFYGLSYDAKGMPDAFKTVNLHLIKDGAQASAASNVKAHNIMRIGLTAGGEASGFDYRLTYAQMSGDECLTTSNCDSKVDQKGNMMDAEFGFAMPEMMNMRIYAGYHNDSGDDGSSATENGTYDPFFYNGYDNGGGMNLFNWGNLTYMNVGVTMNAMDDLGVGFAYFMFSKSEAKAATSSNGGFSHAASGSNTETDLGSEIDFWATKKYDEGFSITGRYSMFTPNDKLFTTNKETMSEIFVEAAMTF